MSTALDAARARLAAARAYLTTVTLDLDAPDGDVKEARRAVESARREVAEIEAAK